jgi:bis(5'-nucleosidyl)-tetraphosphatase
LQAYIKLKEKEIKVGKGKKEDHGRSGNITVFGLNSETEFSSIEGYAKSQTSMKSEESIGCVMTYEHVVGEQADKPKRKEDLFLLMQSRRGDWNFVKGHREHGESDEETLRREVYEETGIESFKILGFIGKIKYKFLNKANQRISKEVKFYLTLSDTRRVRLSSEHVGFTWVDYEQGIEILSFPRSVLILHRAVKMKKALRATTH